jgi:hypothetical protein
MKDETRGSTVEVEGLRLGLEAVCSFRCWLIILQVPKSTYRKPVEERALADAFEINKQKAGVSVCGIQYSAVRIMITFFSSFLGYIA